MLNKIASRLPGMVYQFRMNPDGSTCFPYASDAIADIYRVNAKDVRTDASAVFKTLHPDDFGGVVASIQNSALALSPWLHEYRVKFDDGTVRWLLGNALPEREPDGATLWHGFITDITARKETEQKVQLAIQGQVQLNRSLEMISECQSVIAKARDEQTMLQEVCQLMGQTSPFLLTWIGLTKSDTDASIVPQAQFGKTDGLLKSIQLAWAAEQAAGFSATLKAVQTASTQVVDLDADDHFNALWRQASRHEGARSVASLPLLLGQRLLGVWVIHSGAENEFSTAEIRLLEGLASHLAFGLKTLRVRRELDRHQLQLEELVVERTQEIKVLNKDLHRKKDEADAANLAKSDFLSNLSHELRTPLNAVLGLTGLLAQSPLNSRQTDYAEKIQFSAKALRTLIDDILDFSKIEANALRLEQAPFSLDEMLTSVASVLAVGVGHKPIEPLLDVADNVPDQLVGDVLRLQQILLNLISNAVKFTHHGEIVLSVRCLAGQDAQEGEPTTLQFCVRDTGIGMNANTIAMIFNGFTQADASTSRMYGGTGLGLAISARLAKLMGSHIEVDSVLGQGSTFRLTLGLATGLKNHKSPVPAEPEHMRVLIAAQNPLSRTLLTRFCQRLGWQAQAFEPGASSLDEAQRTAAQNQAFGLLLLDWCKPNRDMLALQQTHASTGFALPKRVLMAPLVEIENAVASCGEGNFDAIIAKPLSPRSLLEVVRKVFKTDEEHNTPLPPQRKLGLAGLRLLVAEDNALNQELIEQLLTQAGAQVVLANDGRAVLAALQQPGAHFDAVLMDIQMPVMDGYTATRHIRETLGLLQLPIIAVTAHARPQDRERSRQAGMVGHLVKPLNVDDLISLVTSATSPDDQPDQAPIRASMNVAGALEMFGGDRAKWLAILKKFVAQHGNDVAQARDCYADGNTEQARQLVHGLRGLTAFLHATELNQLASQAETALEDGDAALIPGLFDAMQTAMAAVKSTLEHWETLTAPAGT